MKDLFIPIHDVLLILPVFYNYLVLYLVQEILVSE